MATYPNARRNKFSDTLYRPNDIKPLDGEVLVDDGADMRTEQRMQELKKVLGKARQEMSGSDSMDGGQANDQVSGGVPTNYSTEPRVAPIGAVQQSQMLDGPYIKKRVLPARPSFAGPASNPGDIPNIVKAPSVVSSQKRANDMMTARSMDANKMLAKRPDEGVGPYHSLEGIPTDGTLLDNTDYMHRQPGVKYRSAPPQSPPVPGELVDNKTYMNRDPNASFDESPSVVPPKPNNNDQAYLGALGITGADKLQPAPVPIPGTLPDNLRKPPITPPSISVYTPNIVDPNKSIEMNKSLRADATVGTSDNAVDQDPSVIAPRRRIAVDPAMPVDAVPADANPVRREMADAMPAAPNHRYRPGERAGADPITGKGNGGNVPAWTKRSEMPGAAGRQLADMVNPNPTNRSAEDQAIIDTYGKEFWAAGGKMDGTISPIPNNMPGTEGMKTGRELYDAIKPEARKLPKVSGGADATVDGGVPIAAPSEEQRALAQAEKKFPLGVVANPPHPPAPQEQLAGVSDAPAKSTGTDPEALKRGFVEDRARADAVANAPRLPTAIPEGSQPDPYPLDTARRNQAEFDRVAANPNSTPRQIAEARQQMDQARNIASGYRTYGFRSSETPEQSANINRQLAAARQPLDPAGSFNTDAERNKWDALRGSMGNDEIARAERDARFMEQVKNGPQSQEETYWRINQRRAAEGLPPVAMPSAQETANLRGQAETNKAVFANANQNAGLARQQQNAEAEKSYNAQRAAQGEARRLGIPPAAAAMFDPSAQPGTPAYDGNMALINPGVAIENARNSGDARDQDRKDREAAANMHVQAWQAEKKRLQELWDRSPPGERVKIEQQMRDGEASAMSRAMNAMIGGQAGGQPGAMPGIPTPPPAPTPRPAPPPGAPGAPAANQPNISANGMELPNIAPATTASEFAANQANYRPNFAALHGVSGWNNEQLNGTFNNIYKPSAGPYEDTNGDGFPSFGDNGIVTRDDLQYYQGQQHAKRMLGDLMAEAPNQMVSTIGALIRGKSREQAMYDGLKAKFPQYGEDAIRYAIAQTLGTPSLVTDYSAWNDAVPNR